MIVTCWHVADLPVPPRRGREAIALIPEILQRLGGGVAEDEGQDKTHDPTGNIQDFRERGQVLKSRRGTTTIGLMTGGIAMLYAARSLGQAVSDVFMTVTAGPGGAAYA